MASRGFRLQEGEEEGGSLGGDVRTSLRRINGSSRCILAVMEHIMGPCMSAPARCSVVHTTEY
jgi:hypothetical protein